MSKIGTCVQFAQPIIYPSYYPLIQSLKSRMLSEQKYTKPAFSLRTGQMGTGAFLRCVQLSPVAQRRCVQRLHSEAFPFPGQSQNNDFQSKDDNYWWTMDIITSAVKFSNIFDQLKNFIFSVPASCPLQLLPSCQASTWPDRRGDHLVLE